MWRTAMSERRYSMKKVLLKVTGVLMAAVLWLSGGTVSQAAKLKDKTLEQAYVDVMAYAEKNGVELSMTLKDFTNNYNGGSVALYEQSYYSVLRKNTIAENFGLDLLNSDLFEVIDIGKGAERQSSSSSSGKSTCEKNTCFSSSVSTSRFTFFPSSTMASIFC